MSIPGYASVVQVEEPPSAAGEVDAFSSYPRRHLETGSVDRLVRDLEAANNPGLARPFQDRTRRATAPPDRAGHWCHDGGRVHLDPSVGRVRLVRSRARSG